MQNFLSQLKEWYEKHRKEIIADYFSFLRIPSVSAEPEHEKDMQAAADFVLQYIKKFGMKAELLTTPHFPLVYAEDLRAGPEAPTLLIYGHYDVQPVDPLDLWKSDPFEPKVVGTEVYARGAQDDKGQIFYTLTAIRAFLALKGKLPLNLKLCIEGEEEAASLGLSKTLLQYKHKLAADSFLVPDSEIPARDIPAITLGVRGLVTVEVELTGSKTDLHSGHFGGIAYNPNRALVKMLADLWDKDGKVRIPHFYDDVLEMDANEKKEFDFSCDPAHYTKNFGIAAFGNEKGYDILETSWIRPVVEINGLGGGYFGKGFKTVLPAKAIAKISCRLVPKQDPQKIMEQLRKFLEERVPKGMEMKFINHGLGEALRGSLRSDLAKSVSSAYEEVFKKPCRKIMSGGSIPVLGEMVKVLGAEIVMMGLGLEEDAIHAPNEKFGLDRFEQGFLIVAKTIENYGEKGRA